VVSESSQTITIVTALVKEDERGSQGHTSKSLFHQSVTWHHAANMHYFYTSAFSASCIVLSAMDGKIEQHVCIKFCVTLCKSVTKTLETLCEDFGEHSLRRTVVFEWHSRLKAGQVSVEDDEFRVTKQQKNDRKC
jgi:hypothetical protein